MDHPLDAAVSVSPVRSPRCRPVYRSATLELVDAEANRSPGSVNLAGMTVSVSQSLLRFAVNGGHPV